MPAIQHSLGLHRLAAKNPEGGDDDGDSERGWRGILHMAEVSRRSLGARHTSHINKDGRKSGFAASELDGSVFGRDLQSSDTPANSLTMVPSRRRGGTNESSKFLTISARSSRP